MARLVLIVLLALLVAPASAAADFGYHGAFGGSGQVNGKLYDPRSVAVSPSGEVFVVDSLSRIQRWGPGGNLISAWKGSDSIDSIRSLGFDSSGVLYSAESGVIKRWAADGSLLGSWATSGSVVAMAVSADGFVYTGENPTFGSALIRKSTLDGTLVKTWNTTDDPKELAAGPGGVYSAEGPFAYAREVRRYSPEGDVLGAWGGFHADRGPAGLGVDLSGRVLAADPSNKRIQVFDAAGNLQSTFGTGQPVEVAGAPNGDVFVIEVAPPISSAEKDACFKKPSVRAACGDRVLRYGNEAPPAAPSPMSISPSVKLELLPGPARDACGKRDDGRRVKICTFYRAATLSWSAGCAATGPLALNGWEVGVNSATGRESGYTLVADPRPLLEPAYETLTDSITDKPAYLFPDGTKLEELPRAGSGRVGLAYGTAAGGNGGVRVLLRPGSRVIAKGSFNCSSHSQPNGELVSTSATAKSAPVVVPPSFFVNRIQLSRGKRGRLLGIGEAPAVSARKLRRGKEIRVFFGLGYDESILKGSSLPRNVRFFAKGAGVNRSEKLKAFQLEDAGPRMVVKPRKRGTLAMWSTIGGVKSNVVKLKIR